MKWDEIDDDDDDDDDDDCYGWIVMLEELPQIYEGELTMT